MHTIEIANKESIESINKIRKAITDDVTSDHTLSDIDEFEVKLSDERASFVASLEGKIVGYLTLHHQDVLRKSGDAIFEIFVHPDAQRKGIGRALVKHAIEFARNNMHFDRLILGVLNSNSEAIKLYESLGFHEERRDQNGMYMAKNIKI